MKPDSPSGIYVCKKCGNEETHIKGKMFAPCSKCGSQSWELRIETK